MKTKKWFFKQKELHLVLLTFYFIGLYIVGNFNFSTLNESVYLIIVKSVLWIAFIFIIKRLPAGKIAGKLRFKEYFNWWAINLAIMYIAILLLVGLIDGFGKSPYDHSIKGITINLIMVFSILIGTEVFRSHLVSHLIKKEKYLYFIVISILFTVIEISYNQISALRGYEITFQFFAQTVLPNFSKNLMATYLVFLAGPLPAIIYLGIIELFNWFSPILPNLKWITTSLIGTLVPIFSWMFLRNHYLKEARIVRKREPSERPLSWMFSATFSILFVWFAVGVFPIYPSVIATGSMEPLIKPGDIILVKKMKSNEVEVGDIIQFQRGNILISHRVIEVAEEDGERRYITKGDNNSVEDTEPVSPENIKGRIISTVPKIGWVSLIFKSKNEVPKSEVEF